MTRKILKLYSNTNVIILGKFFYKVRNLQLDLY